MNKESFKITATVFSLILVLISGGCSTKAVNESKEDNETLPAVVQEEQAIGESGVLNYDNPSQSEVESSVPGEGGDLLKDKFKGGLKGKGIYIGEVQGDNIPYEARIIKTGSYTSGKEFPSVGLYRSTKDLGAIDTIDYGPRYDEEFFKTKALIVVELRATSGSIRYEVSKVVQNGDEITVQITATRPEIGTMDMAEWAAIIEIDNSTINDNTKVNFVIK